MKTSPMMRHLNELYWRDGVAWGPFGPSQPTIGRTGRLILDHDELRPPREVTDTRDQLLLHVNCPLSVLLCGWIFISNTPHKVNFEAHMTSKQDVKETSDVKSKGLL